jgi:uncharacterized protein (TIGR00255 family)
MTGYGRSTKQTALGRITVELRSTNHRYLDIDQRLPNGLSGLQGRLAELIRGSLRRGRVEALVVVQLDRWHQQRVMFDESLLKRYYDALVELKGRFGLKEPVTLNHLLALPQAVTVAEERAPTERLWEPIRHTVQTALQELVRARQREGAKLVSDVRRQLRLIDAHVRAVRRRLPKALEQQRRYLRARLQELVGPNAAGSTSQLEQAAALAKEADIHEELVRIESHLAYVRQTLTSERLVGKRLDFIAQELMREANTMGAKVNDPQAAQHVVEIKGGIEKIREQVQNLE